MKIRSISTKEVLFLIGVFLSSVGIGILINLDKFVVEFCKYFNILCH